MEGPSCYGAVWLAQVLENLSKLRVAWFRPISADSWEQYSRLSQEAEVTPGLVVSAGQRSKALFKNYQGIHAEAQIQCSKTAIPVPRLNVWNYLKRAVHAWQPSNLTQLDTFCKEKCSKIPAARIQGLIGGYKKHLHAVISAKGGSTKYWCDYSIGVPTFLHLLVILMMHTALFHCRSTDLKCDFSHKV